jgi:cysteinyl-tRNA synthetase
MIELIAELIDRGFAYVTEDGNVYYDVSRFPSYGALSGNRLDDLVAGARVELATDKRRPADFALWKRDPDHQMQWDSPWGRGFPGWHIECSAMARTHLGDQLDIHTGGEDNAFPHHESEIAQSEPVTGRPLANWWVHVRHLFVDGRKMSKSAGTLYTLDDVRDRGFTARELRFVLLASHYRTNLNFTWDGLAAARETLASLDATLARVRTVRTQPDRPRLLEAADQAVRDLVDGLHDDLNVSVALAGLHRLRSVLAQTPDLSPGEQHAVSTHLGRIDDLLGLQLHAALPATNTDSELAGLERLVQQREDARRVCDYDTADSIREKIRERGFTIEDTPTGPRWHRA